MTAAGWQMPDVPLLRGVLGATACGALVIATGPALLPAWLPDSGTLRAAALVPFLIGMVFAAGHLGSSHPHRRFGTANTITTLRAALVAVVAATIAEPARPEVARAAALLGLAVALLDGVDGWFARRTGLASPFGARFDMETDALLVLALSILVWRHERAGVWILGSGLMRYVFVAAGWLLPWMAGPLTPTRRGRVICIVQVAGLAAALAPGMLPPLSTAIAGGSLAALTWSFAIDVGRLRAQRGT